jgi:hypothetical protein
LLLFFVLAAGNNLGFRVFLSQNMNDADSTTNGLLDTDAAIRPFLDILMEDGSLNVSTVRSLVLKILAHPEILCGFDQFKSAAQSALQRDAAINNTLDLFSYGTLKDFTQKQHQQHATEFYLPLNEFAITKLGQLTVLTSIQNACFHGETRISYATLAESLGWSLAGQLPQQHDSWIRNLEDVLIRCVYAKALKGKLCQKSRSFVWEHESLPIVCSRDVPAHHIPQLLAAVKGLGRRLETSENELSQAQDQVIEGLTEAANRMIHIQRKQRAAKSESSSHKSRLGGIGGTSSFQPFNFGGDGSPNNNNNARATAGRSARSSNKRSRGGGSFANENAFRT